MDGNFSRKIDDGIEIRTREPEEAEGFLSLLDANRERVTPWFPWLAGIESVEDMIRSIEYHQRIFRSGIGLCVGVYMSGEPAGMINLGGMDEEARHASLDYWIGAEFEGKGLITRGCRVMLEFAFEELGLNRVEITCAGENTRSRAIPPRLGFTHEATRREYIWLGDHYADQLIFGILAREWRAGL